MKFSLTDQEINVKAVKQAELATNTQIRAGKKVCTSTSRSEAQACCDARDDVGDLRSRSGDMATVYYCINSESDSGSWDVD